MNAYTKFGENMSVLKILIRNEVLGRIKGHNSVQKTCYNPKLDLKFGEILSIGSQDIERKRNFGLNKGP